MKRIKYVGPFDAVDVPDAGLVEERAVKQGATVEVRDDLAASLLEQVDNWRPVNPAPRKRAAAKRKQAEAQPAVDDTTEEG